MLNIFNVLTGHLYVFSGEMSIRVPFPHPLFWLYHSSCRTLVPPPGIQPLDLQRIPLCTLLFFFNAGNNLMVWYVCAQSCPTLYDPMSCSLPGSSIHGIFQARILEWIAISNPGDLPDTGIETVSPLSPVLASRFLTTKPLGKPHFAHFLIELFVVKL